MILQNNPIKNWAEDDRPREKLVLKGRQNLSDSELIAILLQTGTKNKSALDLAKEILQTSNNSLLEFSQKSIADLCKIKGVGPAKAINLIAAMELGKRRKEGDTLKRTKINSSHLAAEIFRPFLEDLKHEEFYVIYLNQANIVLQVKCLSKGGITGTVVDKRLIFKEALDCHATAILIAHNHPSGNLQASESDIKLTKKIKEMGALLEINLLDHLIITQDSFYSFADTGNL